MPMISSQPIHCLFSQICSDILCLPDFPIQFFSHSASDSDFPHPFFYSTFSPRTTLSFFRAASVFQFHSHFFTFHIFDVSLSTLLHLESFPSKHFPALCFLASLVFMRECDIFDDILHHALFRKKVHFCARIKCEIVHLHKMIAHFEDYELAKLYM